MADLIGVVIRKLPNHRPVTSCIVKTRDMAEVDNLNDYLYSLAVQHVKDFTTTFIEFNAAQWYVDIVDSDTGEMKLSLKIR